MNAVFVELPGFARHRDEYLDDDGYCALQVKLMANPEAGDVIVGAGGLRKLRFPDARRGKGTRGGMRVIYYWWFDCPQFWMFTLYDKDELSDVTAAERSAFRDMIKNELAARQSP